MQIFIPYQDPWLCAELLSRDPHRFHRQITECRLILDAMEGRNGWHRHPIVRMWMPYKDWVKFYLSSFLGYREFLRTGKEDRPSYPGIPPPILTRELCDQHRRRLYTKNPSLYKLFQEYGVSQENWYVLDGHIVKYKPKK